MTKNPYVAPATVPDSGSGMQSESSAPPETVGEIAKQTFLAWERLRIIYVGVLGVFTLLIVGTSIAQLSILVVIVEGAIVANLCCFAGPMLETYIRWLGYDRRWPRWVLFVCGTLFTALLAMIVLTVAFIPGQP